MIWSRLARTAAVLMAIAGALDPAVTSTRTVAPAIALIAGDDPGASRTADKIAGALADDYRVVRGVSPDAVAAIVAGTRVPDRAIDSSGPAFAVVPDRAAPAVTILDVSAPARAMLDARTPIAISAGVSGARGRRLETTLERAGIVLDRAIHDIADEETLVELGVSFIPGDVGAAALRVTTTIEGTAASVAADFAIDVVRERWRVLFFDRRPSWMSTFVRREIEHDPRFDVSFRTRTAGSGAIESGSVPVSLARLDALEPFHTIVVGAPDTLTDADVAGLEAFARARGGAIVLLLEREPGARLSAMIGVPSWTSQRVADAVTLEAAEPAAEGQHASEFLWPADLPPIATILARLPSQGSTAARPVMFDAPIGAGRVLVSGIADGWRYRGEGGGAPFARLWTTSIAAVSAAAMPALDVQVDRAVTAPGTTVDVVVADRALLLAEPGRTELSGTIAAWIEGPGDGRTALRLWPDGRPGRFHGRLAAPETPGSYRVHAARGGASASAALFVVADARRPEPDRTELLAIWAASRGGRTFREAEMTEIRAAIDAVVSTERRDVRWRPMRSAWWIVPFSAALGVEWTIRRRRGLR